MSNSSRSLRSSARVRRLAALAEANGRGGFWVAEVEQLWGGERERNPAIHVGGPRAGPAAATAAAAILAGDGARGRGCFCGCGGGGLGLEAGPHPSSARTWSYCARKSHEESTARGAAAGGVGGNEISLSEDESSTNGTSPRSRALMSSYTSSVVGMRLENSLSSSSFPRGMPIDRAAASAEGIAPARRVRVRVGVLQSRAGGNFNFGIIPILSTIWRVRYFSLKNTSGGRFIARTSVSTVQSRWSVLRRRCRCCGDRLGWAHVSVLSRPVCNRTLQCHRLACCVATVQTGSSWQLVAHARARARAQERTCALCTAQSSDPPTRAPTRKTHGRCLVSAL